MEDKEPTEQTQTAEADDATQPGALVNLNDQPPGVLPAVIANDSVPFPGPMVPVLLDSQQRRDAVLNAKSNSGFFLVINRAVRQPSSSQYPPDGAQLGREVSDEELAREVRQGRDAAADEAGPAVVEATVHDVGELASVGVLARVVRVFRMPDERLAVLAQLLRRARPTEVLRKQPFPVVRVEYPVESIGDRHQLEAMARQLRGHLQNFFAAHPSVADEVKMAAANIEEPSMLADFVAQHLARDYDERLDFLVQLDLVARYRKALEVAVRELDLLNVGNRISEEIREKVERHQREFFLREQLKAIRSELGEEKDPATAAISELEQKLDEAGLPEHARQRADDELKRLQLVPPESPEHNVVRSYLEWIAELPWSTATEDHTDIEHARQVLDADHYGLEDIKERVIEFLAVYELNPKRTGTILCFAGPPGVGKTSLGQSIARALGRKFYRFSVGGMRDEAEIKGHRRTYVGAMPGRLLQGLRHVKSHNPVFMLDELDKMGGDWRGDPSSALLEVLDPAQNHAFQDHYLDLQFDLSRVMFIATANIKTEIPDALRDRLEVIDLSGYIPEEKLQIARRYLVPKQRKEHGLSSRQLQIGPPTLRRIIGEYTNEAGVRELERSIGKLSRKRATQIVRKQSYAPRIKASELGDYLGPPKIPDERPLFKPRPGVAVGLAWTPVGGDVLFIEAVTMDGSGKLRVTGQLGDVMSESANLAVSYVRSRARDFGIEPSVFRDGDIHIHFPAGAVKKDGPSAGVTVTAALVSLFLGEPLQPRVAMTGEITLRGEVLAVGGIREKVVAARRAGVKRVVLPEKNRPDVQEIPEEARERLEIVYAATIDDVLPQVFRSNRVARMLQNAQSGAKQRAVQRNGRRRAAKEQRR